MRDKENLFKWRKKHYKRYEFLLRNDEDKNIIEWLESKPSKAQYVVELIREDIKKNSK